MNLRFVSIVLVVAAICAFMILQATQESRAAVLIPSQLADEVKKGASLNRIRVGGRVAELPIEYTVSPEFTLKFSIQDPGKPTELAPKGDAFVSVVYNGIKPDMFTAGRDVIIDGEYSEGVLHASKLLTQCPSKYEPPSPESMYKKKES